ncbi:PREDICTED: interaptin [Bactrocera latifrons]|nr:PREDICTED: interaptin [Bactrocera latifrons]
MCAGRSQMFQKSTTLSPSARLAFYAIALLLLSCATQRASSMSLERLGIDQNELNSAAIANNYAEKTETDEVAILVDDMELEAVPASGNTDAYLLVPAGGAAERESVEKNTIESAGDSNGAAEEPQPNEATDMLMVESNDAPMHVSLLAMPAEQTETVDADQVAQAEEIINDDENVMDQELTNLDDKISEIPIEPELQQVVPVVAVEVPVEPIDKVDNAAADVEHGTHNEDTASVEHETIADVIADAVVEVEKDIQSAQLADEQSSNVVPVESEILDENEKHVEKHEETDNIQEAAEHDAIESLSAMEDDLLPEIVSVPVEAVHIEQEKNEENSEPLIVSDSTVNEVNVDENEIKEEEKEQSVENEIAEDAASKPVEIIANAEPKPEEIVDIQPESTNNEDTSHVEESNVLSDTIMQTQSEENEIANSNQEAENPNTEELTKVEEESDSAHKDENKVDASEDGVATEEHEVNPMAEAIEKEIEAEMAEIIEEDSKAEETNADEMAPNGDQVEDNKQDEKIIADKHIDETQIVEEAQQTENDQIAEESETAEELQAIEKVQTTEEHQLNGDSQTLEENQLAEAAQITENNQQQQTVDNADVEPEELKPLAANQQLDEITQDATVIDESLQAENMENVAEETLPVGEVAEVATPVETPADIIPEQESTAEDVKESIKLEETASEDIKEEVPIAEESQQDEIKEEQVDQQVSEANSELSKTEQQQELTNEEVQETELNQAAVNEDTTQNDSQQITEEKLAEESMPTEEEAVPEAQGIVEEKLEEVQQLTESEIQPEAQNLEEQQEQEQMTPAAELAQDDEQQPQTPSQLAESHEEQKQQQEAQKTTSEELLQQAVVEEAQEPQQQADEQEAQEAQLEIAQQHAEEQQAQAPEQVVVAQQPLEEAEESENLKQQAEEHLEEEVETVHEQVEQFKQEESAVQQQPEQQIEEEQPQVEVQTPMVQQIFADSPAEVPLEIATESLNVAPIEPTNSLLTTIIQVPQQLQQIPQQSTPVKVENDEAPLMATLVGVNSSPAAATAAPTVAPLNVMDSVLNYVNASFMQLNGNKQQLTTENLKDDDNADLNAQLRRYDGAQVWRIVVQSDHDRKMADELQTKYGGQLWKEVKQEVDYLLKPQVLAEAAQHVRAANLSRIVLIDNLQNVIETENPSAAEIAQYQNRKGHRLTWKAYHRLADIHGFFDTMAKTYPDICSVETIGYSIQKRPLKILKISNGNPGNPGIWIDGGMHAREWISSATVTYIANQLIEDWENLPEYMRNVNWYIHAVANPDGYEYTHTTDRLWRKNMRSHGRQCPGVDLNRNFGYKWGGKGTSANPCAQTYRGSKAFSEPETFYISKFISNYPRDTFKAFLSFHSYGQYILYPWGYDYQPTADKADLDRVARQAGTTITKKSGGKYTVGPSATTLYPAAGGSDDWAKGFAGIKYAYTIEMGDTGRYGFVLPASHIEPNGRDGYTFAETVAHAITQGNKYSRKRAL